MNKYYIYIVFQIPWTILDNITYSLNHLFCCAALLLMFFSEARLEWRKTGDTADTAGDDYLWSLHFLMVDRRQNMVVFSRLFRKDLIISVCEGFWYRKLKSSLSYTSRWFFFSFRVSPLKLSLKFHSSFSRSSSSHVYQFICIMSCDGFTSILLSDASIDEYDYNYWSFIVLFQTKKIKNEINYRDIRRIKVHVRALRNSIKWLCWRNERCFIDMCFL